jgi:ligand-binding sensor domain-containing protein
MSRIKRFHIVLLLLLAYSVTHAQPSYNFYNLFLDKGLSDPRVNAIIQDRYGFMWFGTPNGLNRFDGYSIKTFFADAEQKGLPSNNILSLHSNSKGELWIGTSAGLVRYNFGAAEFVHIDTTGSDAAAAVNRTAIFDFEEDHAGNIYAGGNSGLFRFRPATGKWENLGRKYDIDTRLQQIRKLKFFNKDLLYVTTNGNLPFFEIDITRDKVDSIAYKTVYDDTCCLNMFGIEKLNDEELMAGFLSIGIAKLNVKTKKYNIVPGALGRNDSIRYNTVYDILKDHNGRVWIGSFYFPLSEYLPSENRVRTFEKDPSNPHGFNGSSVLCIYEDKLHNIWVGTGARGVYHFNPNRITTRFHSQNDHVPGALHSGSVLSLATIDSNHLLVGTEKGPSIFDYRSKKYTNYKGISTTGINTAVEMVQCALPDRNGIVWMGSNRLGLMRYDMNSGSFRCFSRITSPYPLQDDGINDLLLLPNDGLMLTGYGRPGIFDTKTLKYYSFRNDSINPVLKLTGINTICYDTRQHVWLSTGAGKLYEYDPLQRTLADHSELIAPIGYPFTVYKITWQGDTLWLATSKGIVLTRKGKKPRLFNLRQPDNSLNEIKGILPDGDHIWFCNNQLIGKLYPATGKIILLGEKDGFSDVQLFSRSLCFSPQGSILIGSNKGYYEIFGETIRENETSLSAAPYLTGFRVYDKSLVIDEVISDVKRIRLAYNQNFFSFDMSAFDYDEADDIEYAYMLEGFDKDWQYIGRLRSGSYTNVPGGDYVLRLKARTHSGEWNEQGQRVIIYIGKAFWQTWIFRISLIVLLVLLGFLYYRSRINRVRKEAILRSDYEIKLNELENSALRTQMNPHFIFNSLNTINSFVNSNDRVQANQYISKFSKLVRLILDHSREKKIILKDELEVAELYMQLEQIRFENKFSYTIDIRDVDPALIEVPPLIIQPFVENAILHGLLPGEKGGSLKIRISRRAELLECRIEDNGIGREAAKKIRDRSGYNRKSHGMEITLKRIGLFNKEHKVAEKVTITDLEVLGQTAGTVVIIPLAYLETF